MQLSQARIEANRRNALKSTGPRTAEGKERSRGNALKHGFCAEVVGGPAPVPPALAGFGPWAAAQVALNGERIERCQAAEQAIRDRVVARAQVTWDEDRRLEATLLGARLADEPEETAARLRETYHGCEWLMIRWALLAHAAGSPEGWTPEQVALAFDLLGTPHAFRPGTTPGAAIDYQGQPVAPAPSEVEVARAEVAALRERSQALDPIDGAARQRAEAGHAADADPELRRLRRYEAALHNRLRWSLDLLSTLAPAPPPTPEAEAEAEADTEEEAPEADSEAGDDPPAPAVPTSKAVRRRLKAESRREAKRRKLDQRRA